MLPSDAKSQNSDYGSFCHTPSDTFGNSSSQATTGAPPGGGSPNGRGAGSPDHLDHGDGVGHGEGHDHQHDHQDHLHHHGDTQSQPLLPPRSSQSADEDTSSDDDAGANNAGYMRRKTKYHRSSAGKPTIVEFHSVVDKI